MWSGLDSISPIACPLYVRLFGQSVGRSVDCEFAQWWFGRQAGRLKRRGTRGWDRRSIRSWHRSCIMHQNPPCKYKEGCGGESRRNLYRLSRRGCACDGL